MAAKEQGNPIIVIGPGPRRALGTDQYAHGAVRASTAFATKGYEVVLLDNAPYLHLGEQQQEIRRKVEPLSQATLDQIAADDEATLIYADAGGDGAQRLAQHTDPSRLLGSGPMVTAMALDRSRLFSRFDAVGLSAPPHALVSSAPAALEAAQAMGYPLQVAVTSGEKMAAPEDGASASDAVAVPNEALLSPRLLYNQSDLQEHVEQQLEIHPGAGILLEKAQLGWRRFEVVLLQDDGGHSVIAGIQEYFEPTGVATTESGWVQYTGETHQTLAGSLARVCQQLLSGTDLIGLASLTLAVDPSDQEPIVQSLALGTSPNIAFAAAAAGRPLYDMAARLALGEKLADVWTALDTESDAAGAVAVRLPAAPFSLAPPLAEQDALAPRSMGDAMGIGTNLGEAFDNALAACAESVEEIDPDFSEGLAKGGTQRYLQIRRALSSGTDAAVLASQSGAKALTEALADAGIGAAEPASETALYIQVPQRAASAPPSYRWERLDPACQNIPPARSGRVLVIAGRPNAIGQSRELDLAAGQAVAALKAAGREPIILCSDPLSSTMGPTEGALNLLGPANLAAVKTIHQHLPLDGVLLHCAPGDFSKLAADVTAEGLPVLGTSPRALTLLNSPMALHERLTALGIPHPRRSLATDTEAALSQASSIGYPLLLRPLPNADEGQIPLGGGVALIMNAEMLAAHVQKASADTRYLLEEFIEFAIELSADAICDGTDTHLPQVVEHIELAGIHPGDAAWVIPPYSTPLRHLDTISEYLHKIALEMEHKGFISGRFAFFNDTVYLLEVHLPFTRTGAMVNDSCKLPLFAAATQAMLGKSLSELHLPPKSIGEFSVREAVFPSHAEAKLAPRLGPVMQSTGEVIGRADTFGLAYYKSQQAAGDRLPTDGSVLITVTDADKPSIIEPARLFREMGFRLLTTRGTAAFLGENGISSETVRKLGMGRPDLVDAIKTRQVDLVINTPSGHQGQMDDGYIRKAAIQYDIPYISTPAGAVAAAKGIAARRKRKLG